MDVGSVAGQEVADVGSESAESDLVVQAERLGQSQEILSKRPLAENIQSK